MWTKFLIWSEFKTLSPVLFATYKPFIVILIVLFNAVFPSTWPMVCLPFEKNSLKLFASVLSTLTTLVVHTGARDQNLEPLLILMLLQEFCEPSPTIIYELSFNVTDAPPKPFVVRWFATYSFEAELTLIVLLDERYPKTIKVWESDRLIAL